MRSEAGSRADTGCADTGDPPSIFLTATAYSKRERRRRCVGVAGGDGERENTLRSALATSMMGLTALDIEAATMMKMRGIRLSKSLMATGRFGINARRDAYAARANVGAQYCYENLLATAGGRRLTDILHISELYRKPVRSWKANMRWCVGWHSISEPDSNASSQQLRLESDKHLVQIVTIHKSKVWNTRWSGCSTSPISARAGPGFLSRQGTLLRGGAVDLSHAEEA